MRFPENGLKEKEVLKELKELKKKDFEFSSGRIFCSMCAKPLRIAIKAYNLFIEANLGNAGLYKGTAEIERRVIEMLGDLLHLRKPYGHVLSGGTEANITALWFYRNIFKKKEVILPLHAHFSFKKACDLLSLKPVFVNLDKDYAMNLEQLKNKISDKTLCVVAVAGSTELGVVDNIPEIGEICAKKEIPLHVDAAFGGFVLPFLKKKEIPDFDFAVEAVKSLTVDPHKMGQSTMPSGVLLTRENYWEAIEFSAPYLTSQPNGLLGTRASGAVAATYAAIRRLGFKGYSKIVNYCMELTAYACELAKQKNIEPIIPPPMNILALRVKNAKKLVKSLRAKKFFVSYGELTNSLRLVLMPYLKPTNLEQLFEKLHSLP